MTKEIKTKRSQAYGACLDLNNSLNILRGKYKLEGFYEKQFIRREAEQIKQQYKKQLTQYKIYIKAELDDYGKEVVDTIF